MQTLLKETLHHLCFGWHGFVRIIVQATSAGIVLNEEDLTRLEKMQSDLAEVISKQREATRET